MSRHLRLAAVVLLIAASSWLGPGEAATKPLVTIRDYLVQQVCVGGDGRALSLDPYRCPPGDTLRPLEPGEALPYHRYDQALAGRPEALQRHDSFPVLSPSGSEVIVNTFDYAPFGSFDPSRDGYDLSVVHDGWASIAATRSGPAKGGVTFFGRDCKPFNGWILFPQTAIEDRASSSGQAVAPIRAVHWEAQHEGAPGECAGDFNTRTLTTWERLPSFAFGSAGEGAKIVPAIRSIHGSVGSAGFAKRGHVEVFYFTKLYGLTRWESWAVPGRVAQDAAVAARATVAADRCTGPATTTFQGVVLQRIACRDWTNIEVPVKPERPSAWPLGGLP